MKNNTTTMTVKLTFTEDVLGTANSNPDIHREYIASKAPDAPTTAEEVEALGVDQVIEKAMTIFPKNEDGIPFLYDYQIKGMFKDAAGMLTRVPGTESKKIKAYKKVIDGVIFVEPRKIPFELSGPIGNCQRPLRASTPQGDRVALADSESVPAGSTITFTIILLSKEHKDAVKEWLDYGALRGIGQWRNSGKGRFTWEEIK